MKSKGGPGLIRQSLQGLQRRWQAIAGSEFDAERAGLRPDLPPEDQAPLLRQMRECLEARGGEISARARAAALGRVYLALDDTGRERFLRLLAGEFDLEPGAVSAAAAAVADAPAPRAATEARQILQEVVVAPRVRILTRFASLPEGVKFLVDLRAGLLPLARKDSLLASLDDDLKNLLGTWFDPAFLELRRISWNTASGALLEKFMAYEAVHPVESWEDLKNRLDLDLRYFAFFHPRMPEEPLIFVEVALVRGMAGSIQELLDARAPLEDPERADTAIFYSISNAQKGLAGVSFGGFLIKEVVDRLTAELPGLRTFCTLSPLPGFLPWLLRALAPGGGPLTPSERRKLARVAGGSPVSEWMSSLLDGREWVGDEVVSEALRPVLLRLAARYLALEKREEEGAGVGGSDPSGAALDPVAHFHLGNGARIERLNWKADLSSRGLAQSAGIMANYLYDQKRMEAHHEGYRGRGRVAVSPAVRALLKG